MTLPQLLWQSLLLPAAVLRGPGFWVRIIAPSDAPPDFCLVNLQPATKRGHVRAIVLIGASAFLYIALSLTLILGHTISFQGGVMHAKLLENVMRCIGVSLSLWVVMVLAFSAPSAVLVIAVAVPLGVIAGLVGLASGSEALGQAWFSLAVTTGTALAISHYTWVVWEAPRSELAAPSHALSTLAHRGCYSSLIAGYSFLVAGMTQTAWFLAAPVQLSWPLALGLFTLLVGAVGWLTSTISHPAELWGIYWKLIAALSVPFILLSFSEAPKDPSLDRVALIGLGQGLALGVVFGGMLAIARALERHLNGCPGAQASWVLLATLGGISAAVYHAPQMQGKAQLIALLAVSSFVPLALLVGKGGRRVR